MKYAFSVSIACFIGIALALGIMRGSGYLFDYIRAEKVVAIDLSEKKSTSTEPKVTKKASTFIASALGAFHDQENIDEEDPYSVIESAKDSLPQSLSKNASISATSYLVIDADTGLLIDERWADRAQPIASITKLVTAMTALTIMNEDARVYITSQALATEGSTGKFRSDDKYTVRELMYPLLMVSSNDAAEAIAIAYGRKNFIKAMNDWAESIGAYHTYFRDPSGLSPDNVASAHDVGIIMKWIADNRPDILDITQTRTKSIRTRTWTNMTHFLNLNTYKGGKNGFTNEAGRTGVSIFETKVRDGSRKKFIIVVLNSKNRDSDVLTLLQRAATE